MFAAAIFDMDGLLIDSERPIMAAWIDAARTLDIELSHSQYMQVVGLSTSESQAVLAALLGGDEAYLHAIDQVRQRLQLERSDGEPLFPIKAGAAEFLDALRARGIRCAVASSSTWMVWALSTFMACSSTDASAASVLSAGENA